MEGILLTRIAYGDISLDEIKNANIDEFNKNILIIAYYEKNNKKNGINFIKNLKKSEEDLGKIKILNKLYERVAANRTIVFDTTVYSKIIGQDIDLELKQQLISEKEGTKKPYKSAVVAPIIIQKENNVEKILDNIEKSLEKSSSTKKPIRFVPKKENKTLVVPVKKEVKQERINYNILIKDLFPREVTEICKAIYVEMNKPSRYKKAVKAWDSFEILIEKPVSDILALRKMLTILNKLSESLDLKVDETRYVKYLERPEKTL